MAAYLKIENPGVAPEQSFTLLGASTKRGSTNGTIIGTFGTGSKQGISVLLRHGMTPTVFAGNLRMEFETRVQGVHDGLKDHEFNRVVVKFGGKDVSGKSRSGTEDLGFVLEHGSADWNSVDLALREFVSNSLDRAVEEGEYAFVRKALAGHDEEYIRESGVKGSAANREMATALAEYRKTAADYKNVAVSVVDESQVRAKSGTTRVFVPLTDAVFKFYNDLGKWFLHFSEPESLGKTLLPKGNRNIGDRRTAVIYRRGVRVREFATSDTPSLYDYNLENLELDESRKVDDWRVQYEAARAFGLAGEEEIGRVWQSFLDGQKCWEHSFGDYGLEFGLNKEVQKGVWTRAFEKVVGTNAVISVAGGGELAARKGFRVLTAPEAFVQAAEKYGIRTPSKVLSEDERDGREIFDSTPDSEAAVDFCWDLICKNGLAGGKTRPPVKTFRKVMDGGSQTLGYYKDGVVYINQDIAGNGALSLGFHGLTQQLLVTALEECVHYATNATDGSRDIQDILFNLVIYLARVEK